MALKNKYFAEIINSANDVLKTNDKEQIKKTMMILKEELDMPYIPAYVEDVLKNLYDECSYILKEEKTFNFDFEKTIQKQNLNEEEKYQIINNIRSINLRKFKKEIQFHFLNNDDRIFVISILEALKEQEINDEFDLKTDELIKVKPCELPEIFNENINYLVEILEDFYFKNPQKFIIAKEFLLEEYFKIYPKQVNLDHVNKIKAKIDELF